MNSLPLQSKSNPQEPNQSQSHFFTTMEGPKRIRGGLYQDAILFTCRLVNIGAESCEFRAVISTNTKILNFQPVNYFSRPGESISIQLILSPRPVIDIGIRFLGNLKAKGNEKAEGTKKTDEIAPSVLTAIDISTISSVTDYDLVFALDKDLSRYLMRRFSDAFELGKAYTQLQDYADIGWDKSHKEDVTHHINNMQDIMLRMGYYAPPSDIEALPEFLIYIQKIMKVPI